MIWSEDFYREPIVAVPMVRLDLLRTYRGTYRGSTSWRVWLTMVLYLFLFDVKVRVSTNIMQEMIRRIENEQTNKGLDSNIAGVRQLV